MDNFWSIVRTILGVIASVGPLAIGVAVYIQSRQQSKIGNALQMHAAEVERQKFRLSLLDRRLNALEKIKSVNAKYFAEGDFTGLMFHEAMKAVDELEMVLAGPLMDEIAAVVAKGGALGIAQRKLERAGRGNDEAKRQVCADDAYNAEIAFTEALQALEPNLRAGIGVDDLPPIGVSLAARLPFRPRT